MSAPRGTVQRLVIDQDKGTFQNFYRTRELALFSQAEWGWTEDSDAAFIFESYLADQDAATYETCATFHAFSVRAAGLDHVNAVVWTKACGQVRAEREADRLAGLTGTEKRERKIVEIPRVAPAEAYAALEKRGLA